MWNTGYKGFANRRRIINGTPDGYVEPNTQTGGEGPYFPPVLDLADCPTTTSTTSTTSTTTSTTSSTTTTTTTAAILVWVENTYACEQTIPFTLVDTVTSFSSPAALWWDEPSSQFVVVDIDDVNGNCYTFDPDTIANYNDRNVIPGLAGDHVLSYDFDSVNRKVWMVGDNTGGAKVANLATNAMTTASFGTNGAYYRTFCKILDNTVYCSYKTSSGVTPLDMFLFNKNTEAPISSIPNGSIPSGATYFSGVIGLEIVNGNEIWCYAGQRNNGDIAIYNTTLTSVIATISLSAAGAITVPGWGFNRYWQSHFYDKDKDRWYVQDIGSNKWFVINTLTRNVIYTKDLDNRQGKPYSAFAFVKNEVTDDLYLTGTHLNSTSDVAQISKTYEVDRDTYEYVNFYPNVVFSSLRSKPGTNELWGTHTGLLFNSGNPIWQTDGQLQKYLV